MQTRPSKWSGVVVESAEGYSYKHPACFIGVYLKDCPDDAILHEMIHSVSTDYYPNEIYSHNKAIEEASVQLATKKIAELEGIKYSHSGYEKWVKIWEDFNKEVGIADDLTFAKRLLRLPPDIKMDWLIARARRFIEKGSGSLYELIKITESLNKIDWDEL